MKDRRDILIAVLAGALILMTGVWLGQSGLLGESILPAANAQDGFDPEAPVVDQPPASNGGNPGIGININNTGNNGLSGRGGRTASYASDSNSNNRFVAVTSPIGSGESVLFVLDAKTDQLAVYQYVRRKGLRFVAGRKVDYDLKISGYQDISEFSRNEMRRLYEKEKSRAAAEAVKAAKKKK